MDNEALLLAGVAILVILALVAASVVLTLSLILLGANSERVCLIRRFSLKSLFVLTTLLALALGFIYWVRM